MIYYFLTIYKQKIVVCGRSRMLPEHFKKNMCCHKLFEKKIEFKPTVQSVACLLDVSSNTSDLWLDSKKWQEKQTTSSDKYGFGCGKKCWNVRSHKSQHSKIVFAFYLSIVNIVYILNCFCSGCFMLVCILDIVIYSLGTYR